MEIIHNTEHNYVKYPIQCEPQGAYIEIDCANETISSSHNGEIGSAVPFSVWHGHDQRFSISPYLTVDAINELIDEIAPLAQQVIEGYESIWNGNNHIASFSNKAEIALLSIDEAVASYDGETFDVIDNWYEWFTDGILVEELHQYRSISEWYDAEILNVERDGNIANADEENLKEILIEEVVDEWAKGKDIASIYPSWVIELESVQEEMEIM